MNRDRHGSKPWGGRPLTGRAAWSVVACSTAVIGLLVVPALVAGAPGPITSAPFLTSGIVLHTSTNQVVCNSTTLGSIPVATVHRSSGIVHLKLVTCTGASYTVTATLGFSIPFRVSSSKNHSLTANWSLTGKFGPLHRFGHGPVVRLAVVLEIRDLTINSTLVPTNGTYVLLRLPPCCSNTATFNDTASPSWTGFLVAGHNYRAWTVVVARDSSFHGSFANYQFSGVLDLSSPGYGATLQSLTVL